MSVVAYLFLGLLVMAGVVGLMRWLVGVDPATLARGVKWLAIALAVAGVALLAVRGRLGLLLMAASLLLPLLMRWRFRLQQAKAAAGPSGGQTSNVETAYLAMTLDHDTGAMTGRVVAGRFRGRALGELTLDELLRLRDECRAHDPPSVPLIESYLDREHGPDWRPAGEAAGEEKAAPEPPGGGAMTRAEAYEILGIAEGASREEVKEAHRHLMLKMHPDLGGSTYLAAKINRAKDVLLAE